MVLEQEHRLGMMGDGDDVGDVDCDDDLYEENEYGKMVVVRGHVVMGVGEDGSGNQCEDDLD